MRPPGRPTPRGATYRAYGLTLASDRALPELTPAPRALAAAGPQVRIRLAGRRVPRPAAARWFISWRRPDGGPWLTCGRASDGYLLRFHGLADFSVDAAGREIVGHAGRGTPPDTLRHLLLDQVLPLVVNLRGGDALHATAVLTPRGAIAFTGPTGAGKSTLAGSFRRAGYPVLSDDCLVVGEDGGRVLATPAYPGLRLWDDALAALSEPRARSGAVAHYSAKRRLACRDDRRHFLGGPYRVARVYAVGRAAASAAPRVDRLSRRDGLVELLGAAFRLDVTDRAMLVRQLRFLARVAARVPVRRLRVPARFAALPATRAAILADLGAR